MQGSCRDSLQERCSDIQYSIFCRKAGSNLKTEGGEDIPLSWAVRQNAFMTPAGVAFSNPASVPLLPHHPSINPAVGAQSIATLHLSVPIRSCYILITCLLTLLKTEINLQQNATKDKMFPSSRATLRVKETRGITLTLFNVLLHTHY